MGDLSTPSGSLGRGAPSQFGRRSPNAAEARVLSAAIDLTRSLIEVSTPLSACLGDPCSPLVVAHTRRAREEARLEVELGQGPGVTAFHTRAVVVADGADLCRRWPAFASAVAALPCQTVLVAAPITRDEVVGVLRAHRVPSTSANQVAETLRYVAWAVLGSLEGLWLGDVTAPSTHDALPGRPAATSR